jgi:hypothetical protein
MSHTRTVASLPPLRNSLLGPGHGASRRAGHGASRRTGHGASRRTGHGASRRVTMNHGGSRRVTVRGCGGEPDTARGVLVRRVEAGVGPDLGRAGYGPGRIWAGPDIGQTGRDGRGRGRGRTGGTGGARECRVHACT